MNDSFTNSNQNTSPNTNQYPNQNKILNIGALPTSIWFAGFVSLSVLFLVLMNLFAMRPIGWRNFMVTNAGLLLIAPVLVLQNVIAEVWGKKTAFKVTVFAVACQIFIVLLIEFTILLPVNSDGKVGAENWADVFGSQWRIVISSILAFAVGSLLNILVFVKFREKSKHTQNNYKWLYILAALISTLVAQFIDSTLFMVLAFAPVGLPTFELPWNNIWTSIAVGTVVQFLFETTIVVAAAVHLAKWLKRKKEAEDRRLLAQAN
ncbi:MAG: queuosine precursor transporter [Firmicutes bacterium]|nr:queuosine precursor transporter [Bacillota bacterium]